VSRVFLLIGTNDANQGVSADQWQTNVEAIIGHITAAGVNASEIYLGHIPYRKGTSDSAVASRQRMQQYNARIPTIARNTGVQVGPDFYTYFETHTSQLADNLHPNQAGYDAMAGLWTESVTGSTVCRP
jgi:lysophospholipase L1-like esterase